MCGICGLFSLGAPRLLDSFPTMVALMVRRGPDDEGLWSDRERCAFGFRRLSIQDLSPAGHQPMVSADGR